MRKLIWIIPVAIILVIIGGRLFYYNNGFGTYTPPVRELPEVDFEASARSARLEAVDNPTVSKGVVAIDYSHSNAFFIEELNVLLAKVVNRGFSYEIILADSPTGEATTEISNSGSSENTAGGLADKLRYANALILPLPRIEYTDEEITEIKRFVEKGGRVLIIGDPTRTVIVEALNSIAGSFGIIYANDYLYSLENNDNNYRNVIYTGFKESPLTAGLDEDSKLVFYGGGSINAPGYEIILGDETTHSSISEGGRIPAAAALVGNDQVLALGDMTFFTEPYSAAENNGVFINNIADFLTGGSREFELKDFPFFFNSQIDIVFDDTLVFNSQFDDSVKLKEFLEEKDHLITFTAAITGEEDVIYVGRFEDAESVADYLADGGIAILDPEPAEEETVIEPEENGNRKNVAVSDTPADIEERFVAGRIRIDGVGDLERGGSTLFYLHQDQEGRNVLIILSDNPSTNADAFEILLENELGDCRLSNTIAVCQTEEPDGDLPPSLRSSRIDRILVVSDDSGRPRDDAQTGAIEFSTLLSGTYNLDTWLISEQDSPDIDELLKYDAVIWTTGDYWDDSINDENVALLSKYIEIGGNLILSGASIGFDWDHTEFLENVAHADYLDFAEQRDLEVTLPDHAIAEGFAEGTILTFTEAVSDATVEPDVVNNTPDARVIFTRGPESRQSGAASVIAYEDDRAKVAYFAFPFYLLPAEQRDLLLKNTINWFTDKPLPLPDEKDFKPFELTDDDTEEPPPGDSEEPPSDEGENGENGENGDNGGENGDNGGNGDDSNGEDNNNDDQNGEGEDEGGETGNE